MLPTERGGGIQRMKALYVRMSSEKGSSMRTLRRWGPFSELQDSLKVKILYPQKSQEGGVREVGVTQNCRKLHAKSAQIAGIAFRTSEEGCAKLSQLCREFDSQFRTILCKYPFSNAPFLKFPMPSFHSPNGHEASKGSRPQGDVGPLIEA